MKRRTAKEILAETFREIAEKKAVDRISVQELIEASGYSKTTFYREFKDKYDLMAWDYIRGHKQIMDKTENDNYEWKSTLLEGNLHFESQKDYLKNLLMHTSGMDSFSAYMMQVHYDSLSKYVLNTSGMKKLDKQTDLYVRIYCHGTTDMICDWIMGVFDVTPEELTEIMENSLPFPLHRYLL